MSNPRIISLLNLTFLMVLHVYAMLLLKNPPVVKEKQGR